MHRKNFARVIRVALVGCLAATVLAVAPAVADACPTCKDAIAENDPQHQQMVKGYYYSILFMMSMPFVVLGTFGSLAYVSIKRSRQDPHGVEEETSAGTETN